MPHPRRYILQDPAQLVQRGNLVIRLQLRRCRPAAGIEPAGMDPGVFAAPDVGAEAVSDEQGGVLFKTGNMGKAIVKIPPIGFVGAGGLGDKNVLKVRPDASAVQPGVLRGRHAVGGQKQPVAPAAQIVQQLHGAGHEIVADAQVFAVHVLALPARHMDAELGEEQIVALGQYLSAGDFSPLIALPLGGVDLLVAGNELFRGFDAHLPEGAADGHVLCRTEIQQGVVQIQKKKRIHGSLS